MNFFFSLALPESLRMDFLFFPPRLPWLDAIFVLSYS